MKKSILCALLLLMLAGTAFALYEQNPISHLNGNLGSAVKSWLYAYVKYFRVIAGGNIIFEGATDDSYETTVTLTDPTADRTITMPDATGTVSLECSATHDYGNTTTEWGLTVAESACKYIYASNAQGAVNAVLPAAYSGRTWFINNATGKVLTFKVTGKTGGTIADAKTAIYCGNSTDVVEIYEKP